MAENCADYSSRSHAIAAMAAAEAVRLRCVLYRANPGFESAITSEKKESSKPMDCEELGQLEIRFVEARKQSLQYMGREARSAHEIDNLLRAELKALLAVLDHRAEHGCQSPAGTPRLPAPRNIGGIIGPY